MNKFRNPDDGSFKLVSSSLKELADNAATSQAFTEEEKQCLQGLASRYQEDKNRIKKRVPNTCMWVLNHRKYLHWRQESTATLLWVSADPGCGKSVLSRALVDEDLLESNAGAVSVCYFFFKDDDPSRQDGAKAICAILHQLLIQKPALLPYVMRRFRTHGPVLFTMFSLLWDSLEQAAADPQAGEIICVLDALDECREQAREELIQQLSRFYSSPNKLQTRLKFLATSRPYVDIERTFHREIDNIASINLRGEEESEKISEEIDLVIGERVPEICRARRPPISPEVQHDLISCLREFEHRTYLWLYLVLDVVQKSLESTKFRLERLVKTLPRSVADAYEKMLRRIDEEQVQEAKCLLHIVVAAVEPLTLSEMNIALAVNANLEYGEPCQSYDDLELQSEEAFQEKIRTLCGLFIIIVDSKVYLIHQTAKEFLVSTRFDGTPASFAPPTSKVWKHSLVPVESNLAILKICLSYLLLRSRSGDSVPFRAYCRDDLQPYAANSWDFHFRRAKPRFDELVLQSTVAVCEPSCSRLWSHWTDNTSLMIGVRMGLETVVKFLLEKKSIDLNVQDTYGQTALHLAAQYKYHKIVNMLVEKKGIDLNVQDRCGETALHLAVHFRSYKIVKMLVKKKSIDLNVKDINGKTALHLTAQFGYYENVKMLVEEDGMELNYGDDFGRTGLHRATERERRCLEVVKALVEKKGVNINPKDNWGQTPLHLAAKFGRSEVAKVLIEHNGVKLALKNDQSETPLLSAIMNAPEKNELLENGHLRYEDLRRGYLKDSSRFKGGHLAIVELLLSKAPEKTLKEHIDGF